MKKESNEFLGLLCNMYLVAMLVVLPLYTGQGYWQLGDTKYRLFYNVSLLCVGVWMIFGIPAQVQAAVGRRKQEVAVEPHRAAPKWTEYFGGFSGTDFAVACYGVCVLLSAVCSSYGRLAWTGYSGWYMGAIVQLLFVGLYFFVSRQYDGARWPLYLAEAAFFVVSVLGLLHRLGIDPLGLLDGWNSGDWEYSHMLSTLGNINWLCGYYSVVLAFSIAHFLREEKRWLRIVLYVVSVAALVVLWVQGSQGGLLILAVCAACCVWAGRRDAAVLRKVCLLFAGSFLCLPVMELLMKLRGKKAAVVRDGNIFGSVRWYVWIIAGLFCLLLFFLLARVKLPFRHKRGNAERREGTVASFWQKCGRKQRAICGMLAIVGAGIGIFLMCRLAVNRLDDGFGSGRVFLWRIAIQNVEEAGLKDKLIGAGPDCYAEAVFNRMAAGTDMWQGEHWDGSVFTNAHNEFLSQLCNVGILGTVSYLAIFLTALYACYGNIRRGDDGAGNWLGLLAAVMYGAHSLVSFQQVLNTPLLFLTLAISEAMRRRQDGQRTSQEEKGTAQEENSRIVTGVTAEEKSMRSSKRERV